jgi:hypothetical protein
MTGTTTAKPRPPVTLMQAHEQLVRARPCRKASLSGCDSVGWPRRDGGRWLHFATRRAVVTKLFGSTR